MRNTSPYMALTKSKTKGKHANTETIIQFKIPDLKTSTITNITQNTIHNHALSTVPRLKFGTII